MKRGPVQRAARWCVSLLVTIIIMLVHVWATIVQLIKAVPYILKFVYGTWREVRRTRDGIEYYYR